MSNSINGLYVELDAILDTRFSTLELLFDEDGLEEILKTYHSRLADKFGKLTLEDFFKLYAKRDKRVLLNARVTRVADFINEFIVSTTIGQVNGPEDRVSKLYVNYYPYKLNAFEAANMLTTMREITSDRIDVEIINMSKEELTPQHCDIYYSIMMMYYSTDWLEYHSKTENFKKKTLPSLSLLTPGILTHKLPTQEQLNIFAEEKTNIFRELEKSLGILVGIKYTIAEMFCFK
jgi:hypothetical protein